MPKNPLPWQSLAVKHRHPRDLDIEFDEPTHRYYIKGDTTGWISGTGFLHAFFPHFDAEKTIQKMMKSANWANSKYYGKTAKEIKAEWDALPLNAKSNYAVPLIWSIGESLTENMKFMTGSVPKKLKLEMILKLGIPPLNIYPIVIIGIIHYN